MFLSWIPFAAAASCFSQTSYDTVFQLDMQGGCIYRSQLLPRNMDAIKFFVNVFYTFLAIPVVWVIYCFQLHEEMDDYVQGG